MVLFKHDHKDQNEENFRELIRLMADLAKDLENLIMTVNEMQRTCQRLLKMRYFCALKSTFNKKL